MQPFGTHQPTKAIQRQLDWCHRMPANWWGQWLARSIGSRVLRQVQGPLDLAIGSVQLRCQLHDSPTEQSFVCSPKSWQAQERQWLQDALPPEGVFVDIGAHVGIHSTQAITSLNRLGTVLAIEPNPQAMTRLQFNLATTRDAQTEKPRVETVAAGVLDEGGELELYMAIDNLDLGSFIQPPEPQHSTRIPCTTLMNLIEAQHLSRVDVIKCHTNGTEDRALVPFLLEAPNHLLPHGFIINHQADLWQLDLVATLQQRSYQITQQTPTSLIAQLRQPITFQAKTKKYKQAVPAIG